MQDFIVLIPSRMESIRLPGKPLKLIGNKTLIQRVYEQAQQSKAKKVLVATDSEEIISHCSNNNIDTILTRPDHLTGSDRLAEAVNNLDLEEDQIVVNVQGDEPFIDPEDINNLFDLMVQKSSNMATLFAKLDAKDISNTSVVKLWIKEDGSVINFSRKIDDKCDVDKAKLHLGIYAYRASFLKQFVKWPQSKRELDKQLEQMRAMDNKEVIYAKESISNIHLGVDTEEELESARELASSL
ncbi:MAG: 3-deoxy-manno-octulosonate cytidylyltransferase [Chloroflexi bacterium]|nr:3-deoxy-manno-octulosonate cytidylyltransferase [Chloroflexota bacterium]